MFEEILLYIVISFPFVWKYIGFISKSNDNKVVGNIA